MVVIGPGVAACGGVVDSVYGANACNDGDGNPYIEGVLIDRLPEGTLLSYMNTGADCDDRRTGSVAGGWSETAQPAAAVDLLVLDGWSRADPPGGPPAWYTENVRAGNSQGRCLTRNPGVWQGGSDWYPSRSCSHPQSEQIVLTADRGSRLFAARFGPYGLTVDAVHKNDDDGVREIRAGQIDDGEYD